MTTKTKKNLLMIDGNNLAHRVFREFSTMSVRGGDAASPGISTSILYGMPYTLRSLLVKFKADSCLVVFDRGKSPYRKALLPTYKVREAKDDFDYDNFILQLKLILPVLRALGVHTFKKRDYEADDFIAKVALSNEARKNPALITLVSSDKDFHQLLSPNFIIHNPFKGINLTHHSCKHYYGYTPGECVDYLSLIGDSSDKIPGIRGIGEKTARKFLDEFGSIDHFKKHGPLIWKKINSLTDISILERNQKLIDLKKFQQNTSIPQPHILKYVPGKFSMGRVREYSHRYQIRTFLKPDFLEPFKSLQ